jgi:hypothetical protein
MLVILFKNNETGEVAVKELISIGREHTKLVKEYQAHYDSVFGKGKYSFYIGDDTPHYKNGPYGRK